jgi:hypothetical protein
VKSHAVRLSRREDETSMRPRIAMSNLILAGFAMPIGIPSLAGSAKAVPTVSLTQALHFTDAKSQDVVVGPGQYLRGVAGKSGLKLTPVEDKKPIVIVQSRRSCENTSRTLHAGERKGTSFGAPVAERKSHRRRGVTSCAVLLALVVPQQANAQLMR